MTSPQWIGTIHQGGSLGLGVFDGLHRGHHALLEHCDQLLTLTPHPAVVLGKHSDLKLLTVFEEAQSLYPQLIGLHFNQEVAEMSPHAFLDLLHESFSPRNIVVGYDYRFGHRREGTIDILHEWGTHQQVSISVVEPFHYKGTAVKSSTIRSLILSGNFTEAIDLLGHPYPLSGTVISGEGRGKSLGFPTANLLLPTEKLCPLPGVYSGDCQLDTVTYRCMVYIGSKPTFELSTFSVEVYIPDYHGDDFYGNRLMVMMDRFIRNEVAFPSSDMLVAQIEKDITQL